MQSRSAAFCLPLQALQKADKENVSKLFKAWNMREPGSTQYFIVKNLNVPSKLLILIFVARERTSNERSGI